MMKNRKIFSTVIIVTIIFFISFSGCKECQRDKPDVTFFVAADLHFDPPPETDQYFHVVAMNSVCGTMNNLKTHDWPARIGNTDTGFSELGKIAIPKGVVLVGDITDRADPDAMELFKQRYETGTGDKQIHFPVYIGLGNHDLDPQHMGDKADTYRNKMLEYVELRHKGKKAPVPVENFDDASFDYSWNWGNLHMIQSHRFAGCTENNQLSGIEWLKKDLFTFAADGKPVIIFQHYGFDKFSLNWWNNSDRDSLYSVIKNYNIIAIFVGHNHFAEIKEWNGIPVFQVNNAWEDQDGKGSFSICNVSNDGINVVTCRWINGQGDVEFVYPYYSKKFTQK